MRGRIANAAHIVRLSAFMQKPRLATHRVGGLVKALRKQQAPHEAPHICRLRMQPVSYAESAQSMPPRGSELERACAPAENLPKCSLAYCSAAVRFSCARSSGAQARPFARAGFTRPHLAQKREEAQPVQLPLHAAARASLGGAAQRLAVVARPVQRRLHVVRAQRSDYRVHLSKRRLLVQ